VLDGHVDAHAVMFGNGRQATAGGVQHMLGFHAGQQTAVHVKSVMSGQDVDAGHVGIVAAGHEGGAGRVEQGVAAGEILVQLHAGQHGGGPGHEGVAALVGRGGMALHAADVDLEPAQALFGHLDVRARGEPESGTM